MEKRKIALIVITCIIIASMLVSVGVSIWDMDFMAKHLPERYSNGIIPTNADVANAVKYDRVVIFGIDGMGTKFKDLDSPNYDKIFKDGSISYFATIYNHTKMLLLETDDVKRVWNETVQRD